MIKISSPDPNVTGFASLNLVTGHILSIELLEGDIERTDPEVIQYVNIQYNKDRHVDGKDITHEDRLGQKLRCKVKFDKAGIFTFKVKLTPDKDNAVYSSDEIARNANFKYSSEEIEFITNSNGEKIIEADKLFVSPAGGDVFTISATDALNNTVTASAKVKTRRLLYYSEIKMNGVTTSLTQLEAFVNEYAKLGIQFKAEPLQEIPHMPNIKDEQQFQQFYEDVQKSCLTSATHPKSPYCVGIAYIDQLAYKKTGMSFNYSIIRGGAGKKINILFYNEETKSFSYLWQDIDPAEDWFMECYFIKDGGGESDKINIPKSKCTMKSTLDQPVGYLDYVEIDLSDIPQEKGTVTLTVDCVDYMVGGKAPLTSFPMVLVCTRVWWFTVSEAQQNNVAIHEVGHKLGMVTNASGNLPDKPAYFYENLGHKGWHCHKGIPAGLSDYNGLGNSSQCVMYGETTSLGTFCEECAEVVKKLDLSNGIK